MLGKRIEYVKLGGLGFDGLATGVLFDVGLIKKYGWR